MKIMRKRTRKYVLRKCIVTALILGLMVQMTAMAAGRTSSTGKSSNSFTSDDVVLQWNTIAASKVPAAPPFPSVRMMTIIQLAVFEAVNSITRKYEPYLGTISAPEGASTEAAAVVAAHDTLISLLGPSAVLDAQRDASLASIPDGQAKTDGIAVGAAAALEMIANRSGDGSAPPLFYIPTNSDPYEWQITLPPYGACTAAGGAFRHWPNVRPFGIESASQFRADPPPAMGSGVYAQDLNEVKAVGELNSTQRPQDRTDVARLYAATGAELWNSILTQIASTRNDEITDTARNLAVLNMAIMDASISVFDTKYFYRTWRPATAIARADEDGNKWTDPADFTPFVRTPCFPSYPSAHGSLSGAARTVVERAYGRFKHSITVSHPSLPGLAISYTDLRAITDDIDDARVYGGIHFRFDQDAGERQGHAVGQYVYNNLLVKLDQ
jgi:hypothetical protein